MGAGGCPHDPALARRRAEALSLSVFRERMFKLIDEVAAHGRDHAVPPVPRLSLR